MDSNELTYGIVIGVIGSLISAAIIKAAVMTYERYSRSLSLKRRKKVEEEYRMILFYRDHREEFRESLFFRIISCQMRAVGAIACSLVAILFHILPLAATVPSLARHVVIAFDLFVAVLWLYVLLWMMNKSGRDMLRIAHIQGFERYQRDVRKRLGKLPKEANVKF